MGTGVVLSVKWHADVRMLKGTKCSKILFWVRGKCASLVHLIFFFLQNWHESEKCQ